MDFANYTLYARILTLLASISEKLGEVKAAHLDRPDLPLARAYRVSAVHATLAIEGNPLETKPIADLMAERPHSFDPMALEVINTQRVLDLLPQFDPLLARDFRRAHAELMRGMSMDAGTYRSGPLEVVYGDHYGPRYAPPDNLASQVEELLDFAENDDAPLLIVSCVLHYGLLYLRPFTAGNGRMARMWQKRVLMRRWPVFAYLPVEAFVHRTVPAYHAALGFADQQGDCGAFIAYLMERIDEALAELVSAQRTVLRASDRLTRFLGANDRLQFRRGDYRKMFPEISSATASRDMAEAVRGGLLEMVGTGRKALYRPVVTQGQ